MHPALLLGFALAVAPLALTPGASFTLTLTHAARGPRAVGSVILGTALGIFTHGLLAAVGLSALVVRSAELYRAVQLAGACYLVALGIMMLCSTSRQRSQEPPPVDAQGRGPVVTAWLANVLNPKAAGVYLTLAPQFVAPGSMGLTAVAALAATHVAVMAVWLGFVGLTLGAATRRIRVEQVLRHVQRAGAVVLIALGVRASAEAVS